MVLSDRLLTGMCYQPNNLCKIFNSSVKYILLIYSFSPILQVYQGKIKQYYLVVWKFLLYHKKVSLTVLFKNSKQARSQEEGDMQMPKRPRTTIRWCYSKSLKVSYVLTNEMTPRTNLSEKYRAQFFKCI